MNSPFRRFRKVKPEIRVLGIDDGIFAPHTKGWVPIVGVVFRGGYWLDGVMHTRVRIDGLDATRRISSMILQSNHFRQLRVIMLNGVTFAGFNVVDTGYLASKTRIPVIAVTRHRPNFAQIHRALCHLPNCEERWNTISKSGTPLEMKIKSSRLFVQIEGMGEEDALKIITITSTRSSVPEPLRVAHLIASGIS